MIYTAIILLVICFTGCSLRSTYPTLGAIAGGGAGSLGGPGAAALGEAWKNKDALIEAEEKIEALSHGDVTALISSSMSEHQTGFEKFTSSIKTILIGCAILLGGYLAIPIVIAKRTAQSCSKTEAEKHLTRAPFPVKPPSQNEKL